MATKRTFVPDIQIMPSGVDDDSLRAALQGDPAGTVKRLMASEDFRWENVRSLQRFFDLTYDTKVPTQAMIGGKMRAVTTAAFPLLTGGMTAVALNEAYAGVPTIGEMLVTDTDTNKKVSEFAAITSHDTTIDRVDEGKDFPEMAAGEERVEIRQLRNGRRLSITAETLEENDVPGLIDRINQLGETAAEFVEEQTLSRVTDLNGSTASAAEPYAYRPNGAGTALYSASANTPGTRAPSGTRVNSNPLVDETDLDNAKAVLVAMKNSRGKRISNPISSCQLLVPSALQGTAFKLLGSEDQPGVTNELNAWGPRGINRPTIVSSPKMDDLSTTTWYLGDFPRQFKRVWRLRFEYVTLGADTESYLRARIAAQFRIAWSCEVGATDYVRVVQNLTATTAPVPS